MNFRVVDEHGRQLGLGRDLAGAEGRNWVAQARSAFQALAALKVGTVHASASSSPPAQAAAGAGPQRAAGRVDAPRWPEARSAPGPGARRRGGLLRAWTFGELPELLESDAVAAR